MAKDVIQKPFEKFSWSQYISNVIRSLSTAYATVVHKGNDDITTSQTTAIKANQGVWWFKNVQAPLIDWLFYVTKGEKQHTQSSLPYRPKKGIDGRIMWDWREGNQQRRQAE